MRAPEVREAGTIGLSVAPPGLSCYGSFPGAHAPGYTLPSLRDSCQKG